MEPYQALSGPRSGRKGESPAQGDLFFAQKPSQGGSCPEIHQVAFEAASPRPGLTWLDIGCGTGSLLRMAMSTRPEQLIGVDVFDWLDDDLRPHVELLIGSAESVLAEHRRAADRVLLVEVIEHLEEPWSVLRTAARCLTPGGRIVVTTPNIASFRHRLELLVRGQLTAFRPDNLPHMTPALPHVVARVLTEEGLSVQETRYAGRDIISLTGGRLWPRALHTRFPRGTSVTVVIVADRTRDVGG